MSIDRADDYLPWRSEAHWLGFLGPEREGCQGPLESTEILAKSH